MNLELEYHIIFSDFKRCIWIKSGAKQYQNKLGLINNEIRIAPHKLINSQCEGT